MVHRVGDETGRRIGVATAALDAGHRDMRRRRQAQRQRVVVAARAIGVARSVDVFCPRPAGEAAGRAGVTGDAVASVGRHVIGIRRRAQRAVAALPCVRAVVAGVAADRAHRRMVHHVSREARRRIGVAVAALNAGRTEYAAASSSPARWCRCGRLSNWCRLSDGRTFHLPNS